MQDILSYFPIKIKEKLVGYDYTELEEIRIRNNMPIILKFKQVEKIINYKVTNEDMNQIFQRICENSVYSYQNQIANGYITLRGGHRVGIVGTAVIQNNEVTNFNYISSLNFRIARQIIGCSDEIIKYVLNENSIYNTLIVSPPGFGKTTILRDIARNISNLGFTVSIIDERCEIAAMYKGMPQNDVGIRTDVLNDIPKAIGMKMAVRVLAPQVIIADEIGTKEDSKAIRYAMCCGVKGIFTAHGDNIKSVKKNPELKELIEEKIIENIIFISRNNGKTFFTQEKNF